MAGQFLSRTKKSFFLGLFLISGTVHAEQKIPASPLPIVARPILLLELNESFFHQENPEKTRKNAFSFLETLAGRILTYQDYSALFAVQIDLSEKEKGPLEERLMHYLEIRNTLQSLAENDRVEYAIENPEGLWTVVFRNPIYREQLPKILGTINDTVPVQPMDTPEMGIWAGLEPFHDENPQKLAQRLLRDHGKQISGASVFETREVFRGKSSSD